MENQVSHIGVIQTIKPNLAKATWDIDVLSQWGSDGEYIHSLNTVPNVYGVASEFWSERKVV
jgi:hypothetical protein